MTYPQSAAAAVTLDAARSRPWSAVATVAAAAIIGLEGWDAFHISHPQGAVIAMVLSAAGIAWLSRRGGRAPAIYLGDLQHQGSWTDFSTGLGYTAASLAGLSACLALTAARPREDRNADS
jgi:hypothetical protein